MSSHKDHRNKALIKTPPISLLSLKSQ